MTKLAKGVMRTRAARAIGSIGAIVAALIALLTSFGVGITQTQEEAILRFVGIVGPLVTGLLVEGHVWSQASHEAAVADARQQVVDRRSSTPRPKRAK